MSIYEIVKSYNMLKNDMKQYVANKYELENDVAEFDNFDIVLDKQEQVIAKFTIRYWEPTMFKSGEITLAEFMQGGTYN